MAFVYLCRHCRHVMGKLNKESYSSTELGLDQLSSIERQHMIHHQENGDIYIQTICENCEESLHNHPQYYELDYFIQ